MTRSRSDHGVTRGPASPSAPRVGMSALLCSAWGLFAGVWVAAASLMTGCQCGGLASTPLVDVSPEAFLARYNAPRAATFRWEYAGHRDGFDVLVYYDLGNTSFAVERYSVRVRRESLPPGFPTQPQPPISDPREWSDAQRAEFDSLCPREVGLGWR